jgi:hypothetical protein
MLDMQTISAALTSLSLTTKFIKDSIEKIKDHAVREKVEELLNAIIPLQTHIITLQAMNSASVKEKEALEQKLREIEDWTKEKASHELDEVTAGVKVYVKKPKSEHSTPLVHYCPNCFDIHHKKSIIQLERATAAGNFYYCPNTPTCQFKFLIPKKIHPQEPPSPLAWT